MIVVMMMVPRIVMVMMVRIMLLVFYCSYWWKWIDDMIRGECEEGTGRWWMIGGCWLVMSDRFAEGDDDNDIKDGMMMISAPTTTKLTTTKRKMRTRSWWWQMLGCTFAVRLPFWSLHCIARSGAGTVFDKWSWSTAATDSPDSTATDDEDQTPKAPPWMVVNVCKRHNSYCNWIKS